jgi:acetylserotonin N-methyltransferase
VLHDWNEKDARLLLQKSFDALPANGTLFVHDAHISKDKTGPIEIAEYSVLLMLSSQGKCYSVGEMESMLQSVGFTPIAYAPTVAFRSIIVAQKR